MIGVAEVATAVVAFVAPYLPQLTNLVGTAAGKVAETAAEKTGEAAWEKAKAIWGKITTRLGNDRVVDAASAVLADAPEREDRRATLAEELAKRLQSDEALLGELKVLLGGDQRIQEIVAGNHAVIDRVRQSMAGPGTQSTRAGDDARISNVVQDMG